MAEYQNRLARQTQLELSTALIAASLFICEPVAETALGKSAAASIEPKWHRRWRVFFEGSLLNLSHQPILSLQRPCSRSTSRWWPTDFSLLSAGLPKRQEQPKHWCRRSPPAEQPQREPQDGQPQPANALNVPRGSTKRWRRLREPSASISCLEKTE